jgi:hypothetical protein
MGSNPTQGMNVWCLCVCVFCVCVQAEALRRADHPSKESAGLIRDAVFYTGKKPVITRMYGSGATGTAWCGSTYVEVVTSLWAEFGPNTSRRTAVF